MLFRNETQDWFQGKSIVLTTSRDPDLIVYEPYTIPVDLDRLRRLRATTKPFPPQIQTYVKAPRPDLVLVLSDSVVRLSDLLLYLDFFPSRAELHRSYKEGSLFLDGRPLKEEVDIPLSIPDPFREVRRARRFLEIVVATKRI